MISGSLNEKLEAFNGTWAILATYCVIFIGFHIFQVIKRDRVHRLFPMAIGLQLAFAFGGISLAEFCTRSAVWHWRFATDGDPSQLINYRALLVFGAVVGAAMFLWVLRAVTRPLGIWPVAAAVGTVAAYWSTFWLF